MSLCLALDDIAELTDCLIDQHPALQVGSRSQGLVGRLIVGRRDQIRQLGARTIQEVAR
jgi:hypothetical protein